MLVSYLAAWICACCFTGMNPSTPLNSPLGYKSHISRLPSLNFQTCIGCIAGQSTSLLQHHLGLGWQLPSKAAFRTVALYLQNWKPAAFRTPWPVQACKALPTFCDCQTWSSSIFAWRMWPWLSSDRVSQRRITQLWQPVFQLLQFQELHPDRSGSRKDAPHLISLWLCLMIGS